MAAGVAGARKICPRHCLWERSGCFSFETRARSIAQFGTNYVVKPKPKAQNYVNTQRTDVILADRPSHMRGIGVRIKMRDSCA